MRKNIILWILEIALGVLGSIAVFWGYSSMNIFTLYGVLFVPGLLTAAVYLYLIKSKKVSKLRGNSLYISSMIFSLIATLVFGVVDVVLRSKNDMYETIIANTRNVLDGEYLIIKGNSNLMDYIFIFVFIFLIFWFIGKGNKIMIAVSILMFIGQIYVGNKEFLMRYERSGKERKAWYYTYLLTHDTAFKEVKAYGLKKYLLDKYCSLVKTFIKQANEIEKTRAVLNMIISFIQDIVCIIIMIIAIYLAYVGKKMIGTTMSYLNAVSMMQNATNSIASNVYSIYNANLYIQLLKDFLEIKEGENALGGTKVDNIKTIELRNVSFDYPQCKMALSTINLKIKSNEQIAIVGKNGSGKSTLFKILCGLYKPTSGKLFVNNLDLENIDVKSYRNCISVLFQDFLKYEGTLEENVYIGDISTEVDENKIKNSLCKANVDFLKTERGYELKRGLGNWFDEGGQLSGGQWQKIALARTYYKNADLYLLDEPSSALDVTAETKIFKSFFEVSKNKIAIYITHRVKIAQDANKIIVLDGGKIVGIGTHAELLKNCSVYQDLYNQENLKNKG